MNKNKSAKIIAPLIVMPLSYIGVVIINGSHPESFLDFIETILFIAIISLPIGYAGLFLIVLPIEKILKKGKHTSPFILILLCSLCGGTILLSLDRLFIPGHGGFEFSQFLFVFPMGFALGMAVSLSYVLISGI